jgi:uncharacterized membrane protein YdbT with pleckstrin-like domain
MTFEIDREKLHRFLRYGTPAFLIPKFGRWWAQEYLNTLEYRLDAGTLHVSYGVFFRRRKAIPTERITDVVVYQGPVMRQFFEIWLLRIQTAGTGSAMPEATLMGLVHLEEARDAILAARNGRSGRQDTPTDGEETAG